MRRHNGMRPQDIAVLLKIIAKGNNEWMNKTLAKELFISQAEISESLHRSMVAGLINAEKKKVHRQTLLEFIEYGLHVVFPVIPGRFVNGIFTAHSHPFMQQFFTSSFAYVWPHSAAASRGLAIEPLYDGVTQAAILDETFYKLMALADVMRVGKTREAKIAISEIEAIFKTYEPAY